MTRNTILKVQLVLQEQEQMDYKAIRKRTLILIPNNQNLWNRILTLVHNLKEQKQYVIKIH